MGVNGVFVEGRTHWHSRIGKVTANFARHAGGALTLGPLELARPEVGPMREALTFGVRVRLRCTADRHADDHDQPTLVRQENDLNPKLTFLEEGPVRVGMRAVFDLIDDHGHYHGDGRQDVWLYPEGDIHVTWAIETVDHLSHDRIEDCYVEVMGDERFTTAQIGEQTWQRGDPLTWVPFGDALPGKSMLLRPAEAKADADGVAAIHWLRDEGETWPFACDHGDVPPFYASRWPTGVQQWVRDGQMGWTAKGVNPAVGVDMAGDRPALRFAWKRDAAHAGQVTHGGTLVIAMADDEQDARRRVAATQNPLTPMAVGGAFRCYTEEDGTYEIGQADPTRAVITFPADELERTVRVRHYRRKTDLRHRGGVSVTVDGRPVVPQLISEGELTDDICVPMEMTHRNDSVDDVIVATRLNKHRPTEIAIQKVPGIQAVYESEISGLDLQRRAGNRRDLVIWSSRNPHRPMFELDLFSCALHRVTAYDQTEPVIWEAPAAWFKSCGISRHQYCNAIEDFAIERNGPDAVHLYLRGTNTNRRAQSELWLRVPYEHPRPRLEVRLRMTVLEQWDYANAEFTDIFPYPSRLPETWLHQAVLFMQRDRTSLVYTNRPDRSAHTQCHSNDDRLFYALFAADRGNVLSYIRNHSHALAPLHDTVCGSYIDIHSHLRPHQVPVPAGTTFDVEYVTEIYGNGDTSVDELKQIGQQSLAMDDLVIDSPPQPRPAPPATDRESTPQRPASPIAVRSGTPS